MTPPPHSATAAAEAAPAECRTVVSTGGARLHVHVSGAPAPAPTVVLAHGWTCDTTFWDEVTALLAAGHRVVRYDQRGHGRSAPTPGNYGTEELADDLCAVLEATTAPGERVVVGGHSMGGMTIVAAAGREPFRERVAAAMLCSTGMGRLSTEARVMPFRSARLREPFQRALMSSPLPLGPANPAGAHALHYVTLGPGAPARLRERVARMVHACPRRTRSEWGRVLNDLALTEGLAELTVPTVVVHGSADRLTPPVHAHRMAAALPDCEGPVLLHGRGHMTPMEDPAAIAGLLRALARRHVTEGAEGADGRDGEGGPATDGGSVVAAAGLTVSVDGGRGPVAVGAGPGDARGARQRDEAPDGEAPVDDPAHEEERG
ncbi:alpha/beta fold hydrolase [Streptomyces sp. SM14]|uniref:alpha/beta fold hydrolase n=2 Tax=unclassified Streptomyces TaxID=2593676 RepID=UPI000CD58344|nr:alpha/beta hydrolase [Streptomyces sp. SM14]